MGAVQIPKNAIRIHAVSAGELYHGGNQKDKYWSYIWTSGGRIAKTVRRPFREYMISSYETHSGIFSFPSDGVLM